MPEPVTRWYLSKGGDLVEATPEMLAYAAEYPGQIKLYVLAPALDRLAATLAEREREVERLKAELVGLRSAYEGPQ